MDACDLFSYSPCEPMSEFFQVLKLIKKYHPQAKKCVFKSTFQECQDTPQNLSTEGVYMIYFVALFLVLGTVASLLTVNQWFSDKCLFGRRVKEKRKAPNPDAIPSSQIDSNGEIKRSHSRNNNGCTVRKNIMAGTKGWMDSSASFLKCFCLLTNGKEMRLPPEKELLCLNGIRCFFQFFIINLHIFMFYAIVVKKTDYFLYFVDTLMFRMISLLGFYSVVAFFFISGFLNGHSFFRDAARSSQRSWFYFYTNRLIRLAPLYAIVFLFYVTVFPSIATGPFWSTYPAEAMCRSHWLRNLLYVNNLWPSKEMCMVWTWCLSADMQLFVVSPLFLTTLWRWPKFGTYLVGSFVFGPGIINLFITQNFNLTTPLSTVSVMLIEDQQEIISLVERAISYFERIYSKPYAWINVYVIGISLARFLQSRRNSKEKVSKATLKAGWSVATCFLLFCFFGVDPRYAPRLWEACLFNAFSSTCFACVLAWAIFVCVTGQGGKLNRVLSHTIFIPLNHLNYALYLTHWPVIIGYLATLSSPIEDSFLKLFGISLCLVFGCYAIALVVTLMFGWPIYKMTKWIKGNPINHTKSS